MAQNTALALLDNQRQTAAQVYQQIAGAMDSINQTQQQTAAMTFSIAAKEAEMREQARMNDAQILQMGFQNQMSAATHNAKMQILPLEMENERLKLEASKNEAKNFLLKQQYDTFSIMSKPFKQQIASRFTQNQDPAYMEAYLDIEGKWMAGIANGVPFNADIYKAEVDELNRRFEGAQPKSGYNPQVSSLLKQSGSTEALAEYEANNNPRLQPTITGFRSGLITGSQENFAKTSRAAMKSNGFSDEKIAEYAAANYTYNLLSDNLKSQQEFLSRASANLAAAVNKPNATPEDIQSAQAVYDAASKQVATTVRQQMDIYNAALQGDEIPDVFKQQQGPPVKTVEEKRAEAAAAAEAIVPTAPRPFTENASVYENVRNKAVDTLRSWNDDTNITSGIDLREVTVGVLDHEPTKKEIKRRVLKGLENKSLEEMEKLFVGKKDIIDASLKKNGPGMRVSNLFGFDVPKAIPGTASFGAAAIDATPRITSYEELSEFIQFSRPNDIRKELMLKDLYSELVLQDVLDLYRK